MTGIESGKGGHLTYQVNFVGRLPRACPTCGGSLRRGGRVPTKLFDLPRGLQTAKLVVSVPRLRCANECEQPAVLYGLQAGLPRYAKRQRNRGRAMTSRLQVELFRHYLAGQTVPDLSDWSGVEPRVIWNVFAELCDELEQAPRDLSSWRGMTHIAIDELFWRDRILCILVDLVSGKIIDVLPDRRLETVVDTLQELRDIQQEMGVTDWSPVIVTDMWEDYREAAQQVFGLRARVVADGFHLMSKISEDLFEEALPVFLRQTKKTYDERGTLLRRLRAAYLEAVREGMVPTALPQEFDIPEDAAAELLKILRDAVGLALVLCGGTRKATEAAYDDWAWGVVTSAPPGEAHYGRLRYIIEQWREEVFAAYDPANALPEGRRPTSGKVEAINGQLRRLVQRSRAASKNAFATEEGDLRQSEHYRRVRLRALVLAGGIQGPPQLRPMPAVTRPMELPEVCSCGAKLDDMDIVWEIVSKGLGLPAGRRPVHVQNEAGRWTCPDCGREMLFQAAPRGVPIELADYVRVRRLQGASQRTLSAETGISPKALVKLLPAIPETGSPDTLPRHLGIIRWHWHKQLHWILTDAQSDTLVEILPISSQLDESEALQYLWGWLEERTSDDTILLPDQSDWCEQLPPNQALDPLTTKRLVQGALASVQRQFTLALPVAVRRTPRFHRHRRLLLTRPDHLFPDERDRVDDFLSMSPQLRTAHRFTREFHRIYSPDEVQQWVKDFSSWVRRVEGLREVRVPPAEETMQRSLRINFLYARKRLQTYKDAIDRGLELRQAGITLGGSRQLVRQLGRLEAARQPDFDLLRYVALQELGQ